MWIQECFKRAPGAEVLGKESPFSLEELGILWPVIQSAQGVCVKEVCLVFGVHE